MIQEIKKIIQTAVGEAVDPTITIPDVEAHGHYTTNVALRLAKELKRSPMQVAEEIVGKIRAADGEHFFERVEVALPGFVNFWIAPKVIQNEVAMILQKREAYAASTLGKGKKARIEYVSANPTGPIHFGNVRGGPIGETLCRVLEKSGYKVLREYIHNDVGNQIEKLSRTFWYWYEKERGNETVFPEDGYPGDHLRQVMTAAINKLGNTLTKDNLPQLVAFGLEYILAENIATLKKIGISFDLIVKESEFISSGKTNNTIEVVKRAGATKEKDGALWFAPKDDFLEDRESVIIRSDGRPTYFASDIAYHQEKFASEYDLVVDVFGSNHHGHVPKLQALAKIFKFPIEKFNVILYQYVRLKKGEVTVRMQKRDGNFVTAKTVIEEIGADSMIFFLLMNAAQSHIDFDPELAREHSMKNPVYYVQYAYVRAGNILNNVAPQHNADMTQLKSERELALIRKLVEWPHVVLETAQDFAVHRFTRYASELARLFQSFYEQERVIGAEEKIMYARRALVEATHVILKDVFDMLAISTPEKM